MEQVHDGKWWWRTRRTIGSVRVLISRWWILKGGVILKWNRSMNVVKEEEDKDQDVKYLKVYF